MNLQTSTVTAPPAPRSLDAMLLPMAMMRDILIKTMFRMNLDQVSQISRAICLPVSVTQELVDLTRGQLLIEATGTLNANSGSEMGYRLTDAGRARWMRCTNPNITGRCRCLCPFTPNRSNDSRSATPRSPANS